MWLRYSTFTELGNFIGNNNNNNNNNGCNTQLMIAMVIRLIMISMIVPAHTRCALLHTARSSPTGGSVSFLWNPVARSSTMAGMSQTPSPFTPYSCGRSTSFSQLSPLRKDMMKKASQREEDNIYVFPNTCVGRTKQWYSYHQCQCHQYHQYVIKKNLFTGGGICLSIPA